MTSLVCRFITELRLVVIAPSATTIIFGPHCNTTVMVIDGGLLLLSSMVCLSVSVAIVSPAETAEAIEMRLGCGLSWASGSMY